MVFPYNAAMEIYLKCLCLISSPSQRKMWNGHTKTTKRAKRGMITEKFIHIVHVFSISDITDR